MIQLNECGVIFSEHWYLNGDDQRERPIRGYLFPTDLDEAESVESKLYFRVLDDGDLEYKAGRMLEGITGVLKRQLFPDDLKGIDQATLNYAADRGKLVHEKCQLFDELTKRVANGENVDFQQCVEFTDAEKTRFGSDLEDVVSIVTEYAGRSEIYFHDATLHSLTEDLMHPVATEYIVTDGNFASAIDFVWELGNTGKVILVDGKCTSKPNFEKTGWQLSIYKAWFEAQNPGVEVVGCFMLWFPMRKYSSCIQLYNLGSYIKDAFEVKALLDCERFGLDYVERTDPFEYVEERNAVLNFADSQLALYMTEDEAQFLIRMETAVKKIEDQRKKILERVKQTMLDAGEKTVECAGIRVTVTPGTTALGFDSTKFKKDHPDLYEQYKTKKTERSASLRITIK